MYNSKMAYVNFMGVPIDVSKCWPQYIAQSEQHAKEINAVIDQYPHATQELSQRFQAVMQQANQAGLCPFVPGAGPIIDESNAVLELARSIKNNPPPPPAPPPELMLPPGIGPDLSPGLAPSYEEQPSGFSPAIIGGAIFLVILGGLGVFAYKMLGGTEEYEEVEIEEIEE